MSRESGHAQVRITPDTSEFAKKLREQLSKIKITHDVTIEPDLKAFKKKLDAELRALNSKATVTVTADTAAAEAELNSLTADREATVTAVADTRTAEAELEALEQHREAVVEVTADTSHAESEIRDAADDHKATITADADTTGAESRLGAAARSRDSKITASADRNSTAATESIISTLARTRLAHIHTFVTGDTASAGASADSIVGIVKTRLNQGLRGWNGLSTIVRNDVARLTPALSRITPHLRTMGAEFQRVGGNMRGIFQGATLQARIFGLALNDTARNGINRVRTLGNSFGSWVSNLRAVRAGMAGVSAAMGAFGRISQHVRATSAAIRGAVTSTRAFGVVSRVVGRVGGAFRTLGGMLRGPVARGFSLVSRGTGMLTRGIMRSAIVGRTLTTIFGGMSRVMMMLTTGPLMMLGQGLLVIGPMMGLVVGIAGLLTVVIGGMVPVIFSAVAALWGMVTAGAAVLGAMTPAAILSLGAAFVVLKSAFSGMGDALSAESLEDLEKAIADMPASAQEAARAMFDLKESFKEVGEEIQSSFWEQLNNLGSLESVISPVQNALVKLAGEMGASTAGLVSFVSQGQGLASFTSLIDGAAEGASNLWSALMDVLSGVISIGGAGAGMFADWTRGIAESANGWAAHINGMAEAGTLQSSLEEKAASFKSVWGGLSTFFGDVGGVLKGVYTATQEAGMSALGVIGEAMAQANSWVNSDVGQSALGSAFTAMQGALGTILPILGQVASIIGGTVAPAVSEFIQALGPGVSAALDGLQVGLQAIAPALAPLGEAFGTVLTALSPILPLLGEFIGMVVATLAPAVTAIFQALQPVIEQLAGALMPVFQMMQPVLAQFAGIIGQVAQTIGGVLVQAITMIAPFLPMIAAAVMQVLQAVMPLFPILVNIAASVISALMPAIGALLPVLVSIIGVFAAVISAIVPIISVVLQVAGVFLQLVATIIGVVASIIGHILSLAASVIGTFVSMASSVIGAVSGLVSGVIGWFTNLASQAIAKANEIWSNVSNAFSTGVATVVSVVSQLPQKVTSMFSSAGTWLVNAGKNIITGLINGIKSRVGMVAGAIKGIMPGPVASLLPFGSGGITLANGGITQFEQGGLTIRQLASGENHTAQIAKGGEWRVWAEPETGGEAYIPLAKTKRSRSTAILATVANHFGLNLTDRNGERVSTYTPGGVGPVPGAVKTFETGGIDGLDRYDALPDPDSYGVPTADPNDPTVQLAQDEGLTVAKVMRWVKGETVDGIRPPGGMSLQGAPYVFGGGSPNDWGDCSGAMSIIAGFIKGVWADKPIRRLFSTADESSVLQSMGFTMGLKTGENIFAVSWMNGGPGGGHTAGTLGTTNVEMGGAGPSGGKIGGGAGAGHSQFTDHAYIELEPVRPQYLETHPDPTVPGAVAAPDGTVPAGYTPVQGANGEQPAYVDNTTTTSVQDDKDDPLKASTWSDAAGEVAKKAVSGHVKDILGVFGISDELPPWIKAIQEGREWSEKVKEDKEKEKEQEQQEDGSVDPTTGETAGDGLSEDEKKAAESAIKNEPTEQDFQDAETAIAMAEEELRIAKQRRDEVYNKTDKNGNHTATDSAKMSADLRVRKAEEKFKQQQLKLEELKKKRADAEEAKEKLEKAQAEKQAAQIAPVDGQLTPEQLAQAQQPEQAAQPMPEGVDRWEKDAEGVTYPMKDYDPSGGAEQWRTMLRYAMKRVGFDDTNKAQVDAGVKQIQTESGGNPNIAQQITDVNGTGESAGVGLGQIIPGTFAENRDPALPDDRRHPFANLTAILRYYKGKYGMDLTTMWGHGHGYATGGRVWGAGTAKSDSIPARLSHGEFVVNSEATTRNLPLLQRINSGMPIPPVAGGDAAPGQRVDRIAPAMKKQLDQAPGFFAGGLVGMGGLAGMLGVEELASLGVDGMKLGTELFMKVAKQAVQTGTQVAAMAMDTTKGLAGAALGGTTTPSQSQKVSSTPAGTTTPAVSSSGSEASSLTGTVASPLLMVADEAANRVNLAATTSIGHVNDFIRSTGGAVLGETLGPLAQPAESAANWIVGKSESMAAELGITRENMTPSGMANSIHRSVTGDTYSSNYTINAADTRDGLNQARLHDWRKEALTHSGGRR